MHEAGISTYAFIGPILPYFTSDKAKINELLDKLQEVGVTEVWFEHITLSPKIKTRLFYFLRKRPPELLPEFENADTEEYRDKLEKIIHKAMSSRGLKMGLGKVIHHKKLSKKTQSCMIFL